MVLQVMTGRDVDLYYEVRETDPGDRYLLCSDGLSEYLPADVTSDALAVSDPHGCSQELIRLALQHGSKDNITCIVADVVEGRSGYNIALLTGAPGSSATLVRG